MPLKTVKTDAADALTLEWILQAKNYKLTLDKNRCVGCQICSVACPKEGIKNQKKPKIKCEKDCVECETACPFSLIKLRKVGFDGKQIQDMTVLSQNEKKRVQVNLD